LFYSKLFFNFNQSNKSDFNFASILAGIKMIILKKLNRLIQKSILLILLIPFSISTITFSQNNGEKIFLTVCRACHTIGQGKLVGPDLVNVQNKLTEDWIIKFVKSSQSMVKSGDSSAVSIFNEFNKVIMPDQNLSDTQIINIINYIKEKSTTVSTTDVVVTPPFTLINSLGFNLDQAGKEDVNFGRQYFTGEKRFTNGGPPCLSCHNVVKDQLISGGLLSKDLTNAFTRLNAAGVDAIISSPPFPIMRTAFTEKEITLDEKYYLLTFLKQTDKDAIYQHPVNYDKKFIYSGIVGVVILMGFFGLVWSNRKKVAVNKDIFNRQKKSK